MDMEHEKSDLSDLKRPSRRWTSARAAVLTPRLRAAEVKAAVAGA